jgi:hypothetical protein
MRWKRLSGQSGTAELRRKKEPPDNGHNSDGWASWPWERCEHYIRAADCRRVPNPRHPACRDLDTISGRAACGRTFHGIGMLWKEPGRSLRPPCQACLKVAADPGWIRAARSTYAPASEKPHSMTEAEKKTMMRALPPDIRPDRYK